MSKQYRLVSQISGVGNPGDIRGEAEFPHYDSLQTMIKLGHVEDVETLPTPKGDTDLDGWRRRAEKAENDLKAFKVANPNPVDNVRFQHLNAENERLTTANAELKEELAKALATVKDAQENFDKPNAQTLNLAQQLETAEHNQDQLKLKIDSLENQIVDLRNTLEFIIPSNERGLTGFTLEQLQAVLKYKGIGYQPTQTKAEIIAMLKPSAAEEPTE